MSIKPSEANDFTMWAGDGPSAERILRSQEDGWNDPMTDFQSRMEEAPHSDPEQVAAEVIAHHDDIFSS